MYVGISAFLNLLARLMLLLGVQCTIMARPQLHTHHVMFQFTALATTHVTASDRMDCDFGGIHGTVSCWLWTTSPYVTLRLVYF